MGGSQQTATTTNTSEPWSVQEPYLKSGFADAKKLLNAPGPTYYPGSTVAGFSPEQQQAQSLGTARALGGNPTMQAAEGYGQDVLAGNYLNSNPYQDQVFQNIQSHVMPAVNSTFENAGRYGSGLHADTLGRAMTEAYAPYASQQYQQGLDRMDQMAQFAPTFAANDYRDIGALDLIGGAKQQLAQRETDDAVNRYSYYQDLPYNKLNQYMGLVGGNWGGTTTSQQPYYQPSPFSQIAGGLLGAAGTAGSLGWAPFAAAAPLAAVSDIRVKDHIQRIGTLDSGIPIYSFRYKNSNMTQFGVMAQDVEQVLPEAVIEIEGIKHVYYDKIAAYEGLTDAI